MKRIALSICIIFFIALASGCISSDTKETDEPGNGGTGIANPASLYVQRMDYDSEIRQNDAGQYSVVLFPDGSECEEWSFFRGECGREWRKDLLIDLITVEMCTDWPKGVLVSGINVDLFKGAFEVGYYLVEKEYVPKSFMLYDNENVLIAEVCLENNLEWERELLNYIYLNNDV